MSFELTNKIGRPAVNLKNLIDDYKARGYIVHKWRYEAGADFYASSSFNNENSVFNPISTSSGNPRYGFDFVSTLIGAKSLINIIDFEGGLGTSIINWDISIRRGNEYLYSATGQSPEGGRFRASGFPVFILDEHNSSFIFETPMYGQDIKSRDFFEKIRMEIINFIPRENYINSNGAGNDRFTSPDSSKKNTSKTFLAAMQIL